MKKKNLIKCFMGQGTLEVEARELRLQDQLGMHSETVSQGKQYLLPLGDEQRGAVREAKIPVRTEHWEHWEDSSLEVCVVFLLAIC